MTSKHLKLQFCKDLWNPESQPSKYDAFQKYSTPYPWHHTTPSQLTMVKSTMFQPRSFRVSEIAMTKTRQQKTSRVLCQEFSTHSLGNPEKVWGEATSIFCFLSIVEGLKMIMQSLYLFLYCLHLPVASCVLFGFFFAPSWTFLGEVCAST